MSTESICVTIMSLFPANTVGKVWLGLNTKLNALDQCLKDAF